MSQPHVYIHILVWNDLRYLPELFESLNDQSYPHVTLRLLDNGSTDGTLEYVQKHCSQSLVARNVKNVGFAPGHNQLIQYTLDHLKDEEDALVLLMNADMVLDRTCVERLVEAYQKREEGVGGFQPKLYRAFAQRVGDDLIDETVKSDILDSTGLCVKRHWRMAERGAGELDKGQYDNEREIFAPSGAIALYPVSVIKDVSIDGEFFDGQFFAYREDCDLGWRLQKFGWRSQFVPEAVGYHYRGMYGAEKQTLWQRLKNRKGQRPFFAALATRNQLFVLVKNLTWGDLLYSLPWILFHETGRVLYGLLFEPQTRKRLLAAWRLLPDMWKKRKRILERARVPEAEVRVFLDV